MAYERISVLPDKDGESIDTPKKFTNIDKEEFEFQWGGIVYTVKPGETVIHPKYLVNHAANHLARKMVKREKIEESILKHGKDVQNEKMGAMLNFNDPVRSGEIMRAAVAVNFPNNVYPGQEKEEDKVEEKVLDKGEGWVCEECGFIAKSEFGLKSHKRKHSKNK